jgi:DNA-directed RNA polymerase subunit RPC12/RpoP
MNEVRCLNCLKRFQVQQNTEKTACPHCQTKYRISWPKPDQPKVRGIAK